MHIILVSLFALVPWAAVLGMLMLMQKLPRIWFVLGHYIVDILFFGIAFFFYYKFINHFSPFTTMAIAMITLFLVEFIAWKFFYQGELWFLTFVDWIVPAFLVASTVYGIGIFLK